MYIKKYKSTWLLRICAVILFLCMNIGVIKYNDNDIIAGVYGLTIMSVMYLLFKGRDTLYSPLSRKKYIIAMTSIFGVSTIVTILIVYNVSLNYYSDFIVVKEQAIYFSEKFKLDSQWSDYFYAYPYNINTALILGLIYKLTNNYHCVELITATLVNLSAICTGMTVVNITRNRRIALLATVMYSFFSLFCLKTYLPYSSNLVVIFSILIIYIYTLNTKKWKKIVLMSIIAAIGYRIKFTILIPCIGISMVEGYYALRKKKYKLILLSAIAIIVSFGTVSQIRNMALNKMNFLPDPTIEHNAIYYIALGQNNQAGGQFYKPIAILGNKHRPKVERDSIFINMAVQSFRERNLTGHIKFFISKIAFCWGEIHQDHLYFFPYDKLLLAIRHYTWYFALTLMVIGIFLLEDKRYKALLLGILGVISYLYLSEAGARYVIMYSPIVYVMMGWSLSCLISKRDWLNRYFSCESCSKQ